MPSFRLKTDAVPGLTTYIRLTPSRIGKYDVVCAELCGLGHSTMRQYAHVVEPAEFDKWVAEQKAAGEGDGGGGAEQSGPGDDTPIRPDRIPAG